MALYQRFKRQILSKVVLVRVFLILLILSGSLALYFLAIKPLSRLTATLPDHAGRTNFLLLGIAGGNHGGSDLTDTIIFASINKSSGDALLVSIPRDLWIPSLRAKINTAYYYGEEKQPGKGGFILAKSAVSEVLNQPVDYVTVIDFSVFEKAIDTVGGLDITVDRSFTDLKYPVPGRESDPCQPCRYQTVSFSTGPQHMDGATALKYIRSRNAEGDEGTDFARSARQEKLISAFKQKLFSSPTKIFQLKRVLSGGIITDISPDLYFQLARLALKSARTQLRTAAIVEPLVYNPPISAVQDYQWVLLPKDGDFSSLASYVKNLLAEPVQK